MILLSKKRTVETFRFRPFATLIFLKKNAYLLHSDLYLLATIKRE